MIPLCPNDTPFAYPLVDEFKCYQNATNTNVKEANNAVEKFRNAHRLHLMS